MSFTVKRFALYFYSLYYKNKFQFFSIRKLTLELNRIILIIYKHILMHTIRIRKKQAYHVFFQVLKL